MEPSVLTLVSPAGIDNPHPTYQLLQKTDPVHWSEPLQAWFVTAHEDVWSIYRDPRFSADRTDLFVQHQLRGIDPSIAKDYLRLARSMIVMKDGAEHARLRKHENRALSQTNVDRWRPMVRQVITDLLDKVQDKGKMDVVADISQPLPSLVLTQMFAIPAADRTKFQEWADDASAFFGVTPENVETIARKANAAMVELELYMTAIIEERRRKPGDDLVSSLIDYEGRGMLSKDELVANAIHILIAGHVTTIDQFSNGVFDLLTHPSELARLKADPKLLSHAVEEVIRFNPSVPFMHRIAIEDVKLRGKVVKKGQLVFLGMAAANLDPSVFPKADTFDITRPVGKHLSFGAGPHTCVGAGLGRRELEIGFEQLFARMPALRLDENNPPKRRANGLTFRGFGTLPVLF